jgi:hypothetical protein
MSGVATRSSESGARTSAGAVKAVNASLPAAAIDVLCKGVGLAMFVAQTTPRDHARDATGVTVSDDDGREASRSAAAFEVFRASLSGSALSGLKWPKACELLLRLLCGDERAARFWTRVRRRSSLPHPPLASRPSPPF